MVFKTDYRLMQVKSIAECSKWEHSTTLLTCIKLPVVIKTFVLSIFEWLFYTGFTVHVVVLQICTIIVMSLFYYFSLTDLILKLGSYTVIVFDFLLTFIAIFLSKTSVR